MDGHQQLLGAVMADPQPDEPRLVMADFLEEHGDPRADFIRIQCELANAECPSRERYRLAEAAQTLQAAHEADWLKSLPAALRKPVFRRGFVSEATITAKDVAKDPEVLIAAPYHWVRLNRLKGAGDALAELPQWSHVRGLDLSSLKVPSEDLRALLSSPHLTALTHLDLTGVQSGMNAAAGGVLANAAFRTTLQTLLLHHAIDDDFTPALVEGEGFPELRELRLGLEYTAVMLRKLGLLNAPKLEHLVFHGPSLEKIALKEIAALPLKNVRRLDLRGVALSDRAIKTLADSGAFEHIIELDISNHAITNEGIRTALSCDVARCQELRLSKTRDLAHKDGGMDEAIDTLLGASIDGLRQLEVAFLRDPGQLGRLLRGDAFQRLRCLRVHEVAIGADDVRALCQSPLRQTLRELHLTGAQIQGQTLDGLEELPELLILDLSADIHSWEFALRLPEQSLINAISAGKFPSVHELRLDETPLTHRTMEAIAECPHFAELRKLSFQRNRTTDAAVHALLRSDCLPNLKTVDLRGTIGMKNRPKLLKEYGEERLRV